MGSRLVKQLIAYAVDVPLKPNEYRLMNYMALTSLDDDSPPRYFDAREASALALGRRVRDPVDLDHPDRDEVELERKAAFSAVREAVDGLTKLGAIRRLKPGRIGRRAEFAIVIDVAKSVTTDEFKKRNGADGRRKSLSLEARESLSLKRRKFLDSGVGNPYPQGTTKEPLNTREGTTSPEPATSLGPVDNFRPMANA
ncbi:MAG: hypothetical protein PGN24_03720 [Microbacterium arborescens]